MKRSPKLKLDPKNYFRLSNGLLLAAPPEVPFRDMFSEVFESGCYRPSAEFRIRPRDTVLDVGANVGLFSIWVASNVPSARIFAFEAASDNFRALAGNIRSNRLKGISVHHYAVSDGSSKHVTLYRGFHGGIHSIRPEYRNWDSPAGRPRRTERVRAITLERIFSRFRIKTVDFLKLDCEGAEYDILLSTPGRTLSRIRKIVGEYHDLSAKRHGGVLKEFLTRNGFRTEFRAAGRDTPWGMFVATFR
ncbi:MAG: FkbM family methyltransferase [Verrucomicrobia bacterium]|nr:FkbM family methyltransferase [Verrucomicrobiota bacterium]